jgi:hypothetical protein
MKLSENRRETIFAGKDLARSLERAEASSNARFVDSRARLMPNVGADWIDVDGTYAMFDGVGSPCTQTFGLGLFTDVTEGQLDRLESFLTNKGAAVFHEVAPMADPAHLELLHRRRYRPIEFSTVMYRPLSRDLSNFSKESGSVSTRVILPDEVEKWASISSQGWASEDGELGEFMNTFGQVGAQSTGAYPYIAELEGSAIATGMLFINDDVAVLAGASTIPDGRKKGAQNALLNARLAFAAVKGCTLAMMAAAPGSQSQKNAQKNGFQIAYTRTKWQLLN